MKVDAGPDTTRTRLHASTLRPDIGGTFLWDRCRCACCREQQDGTDYKNILLHKSVPQIFASDKDHAQNLSTSSFPKKEAAPVASIERGPTISSGAGMG